MTLTPTREAAITAGPVPALCCDLCDWPMALPDHLRGARVIYGLLVCTSCIEENLQSEIVQ